MSKVSGAWQGMPLTHSTQEPEVERFGTEFSVRGQAGLHSQIHFRLTNQQMQNKCMPRVQSFLEFGGDFLSVGLV